MRLFVTSRLKVLVSLFALVAMFKTLSAAQQKPSPSEQSHQLVASAPDTSSEGVQTILDAYVEALGGRAALEQLKTRTARGTIDVPNRDYLSQFLAYWEAPDQAWLGVAGEPGANLTSGFDGKVGWRGGAGEWGTYEVLSPIDVQDLLRVVDPLRYARLQDLYSGILRELPNSKASGAADVLRVASEGAVLRFLFDPHTHLLNEIEEQRTNESFPRRYQFGNYRKVDGSKFPFLIHEIVPVPNLDPHVARIERTIRFGKLSHNKEIPGNLFRPPAGWTVVPKMRDGVENR